jgi:signal transduction histidine kinase
MAYVPILLLHLISLGYLLLHSPKSRQTWLFSGWLAGMTLMVATQCAARVVYAPQLSAHLDWWGGVGGVTLALVALLQFAYHFPQLRYPREAKCVLVVSLLVTGTLFVWMAIETFPPWSHNLGVNVPVDTNAAFAPSAAWPLYSFERFFFGLVRGRDAGFWVSFKCFDIWQALANLWVMSIWVRKTIQYSTAPQHHRPLRDAVSALLFPRGREARLARAWGLLMVLSPLPVLASVLESSNLLPPATFALVHLLVLGAIMLTYVNYAPEPTSLMVKLVGIFLVTLLIVFGIVSDAALRARQRVQVQVHRAQIDHLKTLLAAHNLRQAPADILYVAARPVGGLFADRYHMRLARTGAPDAAYLKRQDALLREGVLRGHLAAQVAMHHAFPWLDMAQVTALAGNSSAMQQIAIPENVPSYRGVLTPPADYVLCYSFVDNDVQYQVGYSYAAYRAMLHRAALPLLKRQLGITSLTLALFPLFFRTGLVTPLARLLKAIERVDRGDLDSTVPVQVRDEIGRLTHGFNRMLTSLRASDTALRDLNVELEQRVLDRTLELTTLYEITALINQAHTPGELLTAALPQVAAGVGAVAGVILLPDELNELLVLQATHQIALDTAELIVQAPLWKMALPHPSTLLVHDLSSDPRIRRFGLYRIVSQESFPYLTLVSVPIPIQNKQSGLLILFGDVPFLFNAEDLELLETIAKQLSVALENLRLRSHAASTAALEERQRLARDLHDAVTQQLYSQTLFVDAAAKSLDAGKHGQVAEYLSLLDQSAIRARREMRLMLYRLQPPLLDRLGLVGALRRRLELVEQRAGIQTDFTCDLDVPLADVVSRTIYYVAEETLNNALKHAAADRVCVSITHRDGYLMLSVQDNGSGFIEDNVAAGLGLQNMRERAESLDGTLCIETGAECGTCIRLRIPESRIVQNEQTSNHSLADR